MVDVGVLGATGMVGQRFIELLDKHPKFEVKVLTASPRSEGKPYEEAAKWYLQSKMPESVKDIKVVRTDPSKVRDVDILFSALPPDIAAKVEPKFAEKYVVASNASAMRMEPDVPLVIPEVNPDFLDLIEVQQRERGWDGFIVTNPNCTTIALTLTLKPIHDQYTIKRVYVATMQAVSGAGYNGVPSMTIIDNIVPYIGGEEEKIETETLHLLGELEEGKVTPAQFGISASCHRVPVLDGHTEAVFIELEEKFEIDDIKRIMDEFQGIPQKLELPSAPEKPIIVREDEDRPQPRLDRDESNGMAVTVGRLRMDAAFENSLRYVLVGHNTIRGAAGASILNAELINEIIF